MAWDKHSITSVIFLLKMHDPRVSMRKAKLDKPKLITFYKVAGFSISIVKVMIVKERLKRSFQGKETEEPKHTVWF